LKWQSKGAQYNLSTVTEYLYEIHRRVKMEVRKVNTEKEIPNVNRGALS